MPVSVLDNMTIRCCVRCGGDHSELKFKAFHKASGTWSHWCPCPKTGEPIMLRIASHAAPEDPEPDENSRLEEHIRGDDIVPFVHFYGDLAALFDHHEGSLMERMGEVVELLEWLRIKGKVQSMAMDRMNLGEDHPLIPAAELCQKVEQVLPAKRQKEKKPIMTLFERGAR